MPVPCSLEVLNPTYAETGKLKRAFYESRNHKFHRSFKLPCFRDNNLQSAGTDCTISSSYFSNIKGYHRMSFHPRESKRIVETSRLRKRLPRSVNANSFWRRTFRNDSSPYYACGLVLISVSSLYLCELVFFLSVRA